MIIDGLRGIPITGLVEDWEFTIEEIAPYIFRSHGRGPHSQEIYSYAGRTAEDALDNCVKKAHKIVLREKRQLALQNRLLSIREKLESLFKKKI